METKLRSFSLSALVVLLLCNVVVTEAQRRDPTTGRTGGFTLWGDLKVKREGVTDDKPLTFDLLLLNRSGGLIDRQRVGDRSRYRFTNLSDGEYEIAVEYEGVEVARTRVLLAAQTKSDYQQDIELRWRGAPAATAEVAKAIRAEDLYERSPANKALFEKGRVAFDRKEYDQAVASFVQLTSTDQQDFQAWSELGTAYLAQGKPADAEKAYAKSLAVHPKFFLALLNLGRLRLQQKNADGAIAALSEAVEVRPDSPEANYHLGEAYLQMKKGSKAVGFLYEALKLDPIRMADAHLLLAALYNGAGLKDKAVTEYEEFLKKKPNYSDKKKLEQYISQNKKP